MTIIGTVDAQFNEATQAQAEAGTDNATVMTPLRTAQAIAAQGASLPSQTGNSGKFLSTNGTSTSWAVGTSLPSQTGNNGKVLGTDGTNANWVANGTGSLPAQTGNSGKFLTTDGTNASWGTPSGGGSGEIAGASFTGVTTVSINKSNGFTSITRMGAGLYTCVMSTAAADTYYRVFGTALRGSSNNDCHIAYANGYSKTTTTFTIACCTGGVLVDGSLIDLTVLA